MYRGVRHHLLDVASPKRTFTVARYQLLARKALRDIVRRGKLPVVCGGTGFYIDAFICDIGFPRAKPNQKLRRSLEKKSTEKLFARLKKLDPRRAATIDRRNKRRLIRALEVVLQTGVPSPPQSTRGYSNILKNIGITKENVLKIGIAPPKDALKARIKERLLRRLKEGMAEEVRRLHTPPTMSADRQALSADRQAGEGVSWRRLDDFGLEYRYLSRCLRGLIPYREMVQTLEKAIWRYAKRQMTWWRKDKKIIWRRNENEALKAAREFLKNSQISRPSVRKKNRVRHS